MNIKSPIAHDYLNELINKEMILINKNVFNNNISKTYKNSLIDRVKKMNKSFKFLIEME